MFPNSISEKSTFCFFQSQNGQLEGYDGLDLLALFEWLLVYIGGAGNTILFWFLPSFSLALFAISLIWFSELGDLQSATLVIVGSFLLCWSDKVFHWPNHFSTSPRTYIAVIWYEFCKLGRDRVVICLSDQYRMSSSIN